MAAGDRSTPAFEATMLSRVPTPVPATMPGGAGDPLVGSHLRHFEIVRFLGRGGMGAVYLARDTALERQVALKVLAPEVAHDPEVVARFVQEARAQARLRHPNVAQIYFIGHDQGVHFSVMELLEAGTLDELLGREGRVPWARAIELTIAAARGLRAAVEQGFIHRDVKPSNLMLDRESTVKLLDFGLVKSLNGDAQLTRDGAIIGSPLYMSPEQGRGDAVDHRSDIYSLGCALYHMLTGRPPFTGPSPVGVIAMHITDTAPSVRSIAPDVPEPLERIVSRMMSKDVSSRFPTYDVLIATLERARPGQHELSGFKARSVALAVDVAPFLALFYLLGPWALLFPPMYFILCHHLRGQTLGKLLLKLEVTDAEGKRPSWKTAALRFAAFAWAPIVWLALSAIVYFFHRDERFSFQLGKLTSRELAQPLLYVGTSAVLFVGYLAGFLVAAFHPKKLALHDLLTKTEVRYKGGDWKSQGRVGRILRATTRIRLKLR